MPAALRDLATATTLEDARTAYWYLDNWVVVQGCLFEAAEYVVRPLLHILRAGPAVARRSAVDLLVELVGPAAFDAPAAPGSRAGLLEACRARAREGLGVLYWLLGDADPWTRQWAVLVLACVDPDPERLVWALWRASETDPDARARAEAAEAVAERVSPGPLLAGVGAGQAPDPPPGGPVARVAPAWPQTTGGVRWAAFRRDLEARMTAADAALVRRLRIDGRRTWTGVAQACAEAWATGWGGDPLVGRLLCEVAATLLDEDPYAGAWA